MKLPWLNLALLLSLLVSNVSLADINRDTRRAQKLLAAGDYPKAFEEYHRLAIEKDNPLAKLSIAMFYDNGWGREVDRSKACEWYEKAAQDDIPSAADAFAGCLAGGVHRDRDYALAADWYRKAAELGHHYSLCRLAELYLSGKGVEKDVQKGLELCQESAVQGSVPAMLWLGRVYLTDPQARDFNVAVHWYSQAASYHSVEAEYQLGVMLRDGLGVESNPVVARTWFEAAASEDYEPAYFETARLYFNAPVDPETGLWFETDLAKAYLWLSATLKRTDNAEERSQASGMLEKILEVIPETWISELDKKVDDHMKQFASMENRK